MKQAREISNMRACFFAAGTIVCWSTVAIAFKWALADTTPAGLLLVATLTATLTLGLWTLVTQRTHRAHCSHCPHRAAGKRRHTNSLEGLSKAPKGLSKAPKHTNVWGRAALLGFINPFLYYLILFKAYSLLPAQVAQALNVIWPVLLVLLSIPILGQRIGWVSLLGMCISFMGALVIATQGNLNVLWSGHLPNPLGVVLAASSAILWALYFLLNMKSDLPPVKGLFLNFLFASGYIILYIVITHLIGTPSPLDLEATTTPPLAPPATDLLAPPATSLIAPPATSLIAPPLAGMTVKALLLGIYVGLFEMAIPFILWLNALHYARNTSVVSSLIYIFPFLSLILIHFVLGEPLFTTTLIGLVFIVIGVLLVKR